MFTQDYEHAKVRGANIYAEIVGYGLSGDAYHITRPPPDGNGAIRAMKRCIEISGIDPISVDYVNAHATSTAVGDKIECQSIRSVCGEKVYVSSTKGATGHLLGASGAVEAIFTILAVSTNVIPPTLNLRNPDPDHTGLAYIVDKGLDTTGKYRRSGSGVGVEFGLSNSFGFGGTNAALLFKKMNE